MKKTNPMFGSEDLSKVYMSFFFFFFGYVLEELIQIEILVERK